MDRIITYPGALPKSADFLNAQRNAMIAVGAVLQAVFGTGAAASGFTCTQLAVPGMGVQVSAGALTQYTTVDATAYGELAADLTEFIVKQGINLDPTTLNVAAPTTAGQSIAYLIEAAFAEVDGTAVVLPYVNAANPSQPYAGPTNSGAAQNTTRDETVTLVAKAGTPAATGSQTVPAADSGYVPLFVVTVAYGQSAVTTANIAQHPSAPFPPYTLQALSPGFSNMQVFTASGTWTVPTCVTKARVTVVGGGGGGGGSQGSGGAGGGVAIDIISGLTAGSVIDVTIGAAGIAGAVGGDGVAGGTSSFGSYVSATGGAAGLEDSGVSSSGGTGVGGTLNITGQSGSGYISAGVAYGGFGGGVPGFGSSGTFADETGSGGTGYGAGGGGGGTSAAGVAGKAGIVIVEW